MSEIEIEAGVSVQFRYHGEVAWGTVLAAGPKRVHIESGRKRVYVAPADVLKHRKKRPGTIPFLGENLRLSGGLGQKK